MRKSKFSDEQIIAMLSQAKQGKNVDEICREQKISRYTFYNWKKKFGGMDKDEAKRLKALELENSRLKRVIADQALDITILKDALGKK